MDAPQIVDHREIRTALACPNPACRAVLSISATPQRDKGHIVAVYHAREAIGPCHAGDALTACPLCGALFPRLSWDDFKDRMDAAHGP